MTIGTWLNTLLTGKLVGQDEFGNKYYTNRKQLRRWVIYKGFAEASKVPSGWHAWLHRQSDELPESDIPTFSWQKKHLPNLSGTKFSYKPLGHWLRGGKRQKSASDYQAWQPDQEQP